MSLRVGASWVLAGAAALSGWLVSCGTSNEGDESPGGSSDTSQPVTPIGTAPIAVPSLMPSGDPSGPGSALGPAPNGPSPTSGPDTGPSGLAPADQPTSPLPEQPTPVSPENPDGPGAPETPAVDEALIDDFEDGNGALLDVAGRVGHWSTANDGTGTQTPAPGASPIPVAGGANGSGYAMHTTGSGFSDWGAGLQVDLNNPGNGAASRLPYDASRFDGVRFFARGSGTVRVEFVVRGVVEANAGGNCASNCYDAHGFSIDLGSEWQEYVVGFSQVAQETWGTEVNFSPSDLLAINFKMLSLASFDFWLDDLKFAESGSAPGPAGPGPAGPEPGPSEPEPPPGPVSEPGMCGGGNLKTYNGNGSVTYYTFAMGSSEVNCSYQITGNNPDRVANIFTGEGRYFGAMNTSDYDNAAMCGACVEVTRDGGRSVVITIVDQCPIATNPKCTAGHIDLSLEAFRQIGQDQEGHIGTGNGGAVGNISWKYVPCPVDGTNVNYKLKEPNRMDWNELLVQAHRFPISSVEINDRPATRKSYNYWEPPGNMGAGPWRVKVTDVMGGVIESTVERSGGDMDSGLQLTCQ